MGGHSHTLIGDMEGAAGKYPTIAKNLDGEEVFIVTAYRWGEYLGRMNLLFDQQGKVVKYEGEPIRLTNTTAQDPKLDGEVAEWRVPFDTMAKKGACWHIPEQTDVRADMGVFAVVGETADPLEQSTCQHSECTLGNVVRRLSARQVSPPDYARLPMPCTTTALRRAARSTAR